MAVRPNRSFDACRSIPTLELMFRCPNCDSEVAADALICPHCNADFQGPKSWKPHAAPRKRAPPFWGRPELSEYEHDVYEALIETVSRHPPNPAVGLPSFAALFAATIVAKNFLDFAAAGVVLILLLLLFPYYVVQLLMRWRMREHQEVALRNGTKPSYVPFNARGWAAVYVAAFIAGAYVILALDRFTTR